LKQNGQTWSVLGALEAKIETKGALCQKRKIQAIASEAA
jgi:hypothetical protein